MPAFVSCLVAAATLTQCTKNPSVLNATTGMHRIAAHSDCEYHMMPILEPVIRAESLSCFSSQIARLSLYGPLPLHMRLYALRLAQSAFLCGRL